MKEKSKKIALVYLGLAVFAQLVSTFFFPVGMGYTICLILTILGICLAIWFGVRSLTAVTQVREEGSIQKIIQEETAHDEWLKKQVNDKEENKENGL